MNRLQLKLSLPCLLSGKKPDQPNSPGALQDIHALLKTFDVPFANVLEFNTIKH